MTEILFNYLRERFRTSNHPKYLKYFNEWVSNVSENQLHYFEIERLNILNNAKHNKV